MIVDVLILIWEAAVSASMRAEARPCPQVKAMNHTLLKKFGVKKTARSKCTSIEGLNQSGSPLKISAHSMLLQLIPCGSKAVVGFIAYAGSVLNKLT